MTSVLVTGSTGYIGNHVVRKLAAAGQHVHAVSRTSHDEHEPRVTWHRLDLHDRAAVNSLLRRVQPDKALHLAWDVAPGEFWSAAENLDWVASSLMLLRTLADAGCQRVVLAGSCAEYDWDVQPCEESSPLRPSTLYGAAKAAVSTTALAAAPELGMQVAVGRIFFLFGPGEPTDKLVAYVIRSLLSGRRAACSDGRQMRDYLYVEDVADALAKLLDSSLAGAVNIGSGRPTAVAELLGMVGDVVGRPDLVGLGDQAGGAEPPLVVADVTRLQAELGWEPLVGLREGIARTVNWWRAQD